MARTVYLNNLLARFEGFERFERFEGFDGFTRFEGFAFAKFAAFAGFTWSAGFGGREIHWFHAPRGFPPSEQRLP